MMFPIAIMMIKNDDDRAFMQDVYTQYRSTMYFTIAKFYSRSCDYEDIINDICVALLKKFRFCGRFLVTN